MTFALPRGWNATTLGDICSKPQYGWTSKAASSGSIKYLRTTDISDGTINWETVPYCENVPDDVEKYRVHPNDILVSRAVAVGISYRIEDVPHKAVFASYLIRFTTRSGIEPKFVEYFMKSMNYWQAISELSVGIAVPNVNATKLASLEILLPPPKEQRRIVAKLEKLLARIEASRRRLDKIPTLLKRLRQSILAAACSGRLTRNSAIGEWKGITLADVVSEMRTGPFGSALHKSDYEFGGIPVINPVNIVAGNIVPSPEIAISRTTFNRLSDYALRAGDIIIARRGEMGRCAVVTAREAGWICGTGSAVLRLKNCALPAFIQMMISSPTVRAYLSEASVGTTMDNLNQQMFKAMPVLLPSREEQEKIVRRVEELYRIADLIQERSEKVDANMTNVSQSILAKAFRGELIAQNRG